ncbi:MAG: hypothetical protein GKR94_28060 [Gammaproteobacteria bacterium]|nr:hypothetical protein [Gammaproteobacteria bacterium]
MSQAPIAYIDNITARYERLGYAPYRWFRAGEDPPFAPLEKPLARSKLGLLSTSGAYVTGQVAFHYKDDTSIRAIPSDTPAENMRFAHLTENYLEDPRKDPECIVPLTALRRLAAQGSIGALAKDYWSCMGGIYSQRRVREELLPQVAQRCQASAVDALLLVPM